MMGSVTLTPIFVVAGIGIVTSIYEKTMGKDNPSAHLIAIAAMLVGYGVVLFLLKDLTDSVLSTFLNMGN